MENPSKTNPYMCAGITRIMGGIFFAGTALIIFNWLNRVWNLGIHQMIDIQTVGGKAYLTIAIALLVGFIVGIIGQAIGMSIKITSDKTASIITMYWHYIANHIIAWFLIIPVGFSLLLGPETTSIFFKGLGNEFLYAFVLLSTINGFLVCLIMIVSGNMLRRQNPLGMLLNRLGPIVVSIFCCTQIYAIYDVSVVFGIAIGLILPFILIPICSRMWRKDMLQRNPHMYI